MAIKSFLSEGGFSVGSVGSAPIEVIDSSGNITAVGLTVSGNLVVNGSTTTINSTTTTLDDPIFTLGGDTVPASDDNKDRGIEFRWHDGSLAKVGFFGFDDSTGKFVFIPNATNTSEVFSGTKGTIDANIEWADVLSKPSPVITVTLTGDVTGTANTTLTSLGNGTVSIATTIAADSIALGTDTTGAYVLAINNGSYLTGGNGPSGSESAILTLAVDATSANTASKVVARDASGNFSAGAITATGMTVKGAANLTQLVIDTTTSGSKEIVFRDAGTLKGYVWNSGSVIGVGGGSGANSLFVDPSTGNTAVGANTIPAGARLLVDGGYGIIVNGTAGSSYSSGIKFRNDGYTHFTAGVKGSSFVIAQTDSEGTVVWQTTPLDRFTINSSGNTTLSGTLTVNGAEAAIYGADGYQLKLGYNSTYYWKIGRNSSGTLIFNDSAADQISFTNTGRLGIGTITPGAKLHVAGPHADEGADRAATTALIVDTKTDGTGDGKTYIKTGWINTGNYGVSTLGVGYYASGSQVRDVITMLGTGRVGVGTTTPTQRLHLNGGVLRISGGGASSNGEINLDSGTEYDGWQVRKESSTMWGVKSVTSGNDLAIFVDNTTARGVYIKTGGNVGINQTNPQHKLDVGGAIRTTDWLYIENSGYGVYSNASGLYLSTAGNNWDISSGAAQTWAGLRLYKGGKNVTWLGHFYGDSTGQGFLDSGGNWQLIVDSSSRLRVYAGVYNMDQGIRVLNPGGAAYSTASSTVTGAWKIKLPTDRFKSNTMMRMTIKIYRYSTGTSTEFNVGGYNYSDAAANWYNVFAEQQSDGFQAAYTIRFGNDGTANCIWIGETNSTWDYPQVFVTDFQAGYGGTTQTWASGWSITPVTAFDTVTQSRTAAVQVNSNNIGNYGVNYITGTANQVLVNGGSGANVTGGVTLTLPQNIHTSATPTFGGGTLNGTLTVVKSNGGNVNGSANAAIYLSQDESSIQGPGANTVIRMGGNLVLGANTTWIAATNGTTALTINNSQNSTFAGNITVSGGSTSIGNGGQVVARSVGSGLGITPITNLDINDTNDSSIRLWRATTEWLQFAAARGGFTGQNNVFLFDIVGPNSAQLRPLKFRQSSNGGTSYTDVLTLDSSGNTTLGGNLTVSGTGGVQLNSLANLTWGGAYGAGIPTIAIPTATSIGFYPTGSTSGKTFELFGTGAATLTGNLTVSGTGKQTLGQSVNATVYAGNTPTLDQAIILSNTRRANYGDVMIAKNLEGVASADSYATPGTSAATGYAAVEMRYGGVVRVYGNSGATTAAAVVAPNVLAEFTPTAIGLNLNTTVTGNLTVSGNLIINGTTTTVNSTTTTLDDPIITLGGDTAPTVDDNKDRGVEFRWHNGTAAKVGFFGYDDSTGYFTFIPDATNSSEVFSGTQGDIQAANFRGNLIGNVTGNVSGSAGSVATLTAGTYLTGGSFNGSTNVTFAVDATSANTASKVVARDGSGNFSAGTISASLVGSSVTLGSRVNSSTFGGNTGGLTLNSVAEIRSPQASNPPALTWHYENLATRHLLLKSTGEFNFVAPTTENSGVAVVQINGNLVWHAGNDGSGSGLDADLLDGLNAASANTASTIVARDASGNFSAGTVTAALSGNATTATTWQTARNFTIGSTARSVNGSADVTWTLADIGAAAASHNHTSLTSVTSIGFATEASDSASISTTISGTQTFFDFNLTDDNNNDLWRWRFTPSGSTVYNAMTLSPSANGVSDLVVAGTITGTRLISNVATGTAPLTVASTTLVTNLNADLLDGLNSATSNTASTIVARDASGNFSASGITASSFTDGYNTFTLAQINRTSGAVELQYNKSAAGENVHIFGNTANRWAWQADTGRLVLGSSGDTNLYRSAADTLKTDDNFTATGITVTKSSGISTITFPAGFNDPGYIQHEESINNTGIMRFSVSDDDGDNDYFTFGNTSNGYQERFRIFSSGRFRMANGIWHQSLSDGANRIHFGASGRTYFGSQDGYEWRSAADSAIMYLSNGGNLGIGTTSPGYKLEVNGSFAATTKSFVIPHPTKEGKKLRYGSLEGPENGVYVRGKLKGSNIIELPDYWTKLVDPESITVQLTPIGSHQKLYVEKIEDNKVYIVNENLLAKAINCFFYILAERCDVEKLEVEIDA